MTGRVKIWKYDRGFGFIEADGKSYFCHFSEIKSGQKSLVEGDEVEFDPEETKKGSQAINVTKKEY